MVESLLDKGWVSCFLYSEKQTNPPPFPTTQTHTLPLSHQSWPQFQFKLAFWRIHLGGKNNCRKWYWSFENCHRPASDTTMAWGCGCIILSSAHWFLNGTTLSSERHRHVRSEQQAENLSHILLLFPFVFTALLLFLRSNTALKNYRKVSKPFCNLHHICLVLFCLPCSFSPLQVSCLWFPYVQKVSWCRSSFGHMPSLVVSPAS